MKATKRIHQYVFVILIVVTIVSQILLSYTFRSSVDDNQVQTLFWIRHLFSFGLPGIIILWQIQDTILHADTKISAYLWQSVRYIFIPYVLLGGVYSLYNSQISTESFQDSFINMVVQGNWHGSFVLVILQFTILNLFVRKIFYYHKTVVLISFFISVAYLANESIFQYSFFNNDINILSWLFFYCFGTYIGYHYQALQKLIKENQPLIVLATILSFLPFIHFAEDYSADLLLLEPALLLYFACSFLLLYSISMSLVGLKQTLIERIASYGSFILLFHPIITPFLFSFFGILEEQTVLLLFFGLLFILGMSLGVAEILDQYALTRFVLLKAFFNDNSQRGK